MPTDLSQLPPPPKGQTGITLDQFSHLPPPPTGQKGLTLAQIKAQPDVTTKADQATFPATGQESPFGIAAKTIGNIPSSAVGFVKSAFDFLNPLNTVKTAQNIGTTIGGAMNEGQDIGKLLKDTVVGLPEAAYKTVAPQFIQHIVSGDFNKAAATLENDPVGQIAPLLLVARQAAVKAGVGDQFDAGISKIASPVTVPAEAAGNYAKNVAGGVTKFVGSQLTGLSPKTIEQVVQNPQEFSHQAQSTIARPALAQDIATAISERQSALSDTGAQYSGIRTATEPIQVPPDYLDNLIKERTGLNVVDGKLQTSGSASIRLPSDVSALQNKIYNVWQPEFAKGYLTPDQFLNFRNDLSKMVYNDSGIGKSTDLANLSSTMRGQVNADLRSQVAGLNELDSKFAPQITELKQLSQGLVDKQGNLTDAAINKIANATGKGKDPLLTRLEELSPGITDKIKILKAVEDIQNSRENKPGTYTRAAVGLGGIATGNPFLVVSAILSLPEIAVPLMRGLGYSSELISSTLKTLGISKVPNIVNNSLNLLPKEPGAIPNSTDQAKITDINKFERAVDLSPENKKVEDAAFQKVVKQQDSILSAYFKKFGKVINADNFRPFFKDVGYNGSNAAAVQEAVSYLAKRARAEALKSPEPNAVAYAGGSGTGKTSAIKAIPELNKLSKDAAVVLDSNFSTLSSARQFIKQVENSGKKFIGIYTYRGAMDSMVNGVIKRMLTNPEEMGRVVPTKIVAGNHIDSFEVVKKLVSEGKKFRFIDNSLGNGNAKLVSLEDLQNKIKYPPRAELVKMFNEKVKELYTTKTPFKGEDGKLHYITPEQFKSLTS